MDFWAAVLSYIDWFLKITNNFYEVKDGWWLVSDSSHFDLKINDKIINYMKN